MMSVNPKFNEKNTHLCNLVVSQKVEVVIKLLLPQEWFFWITLEQFAFVALKHATVAIVKDGLIK